MRRKQDSIVPTERSVLDAGVALQAQGEYEFHGYALAREMRDAAGARKLIGHGTLYKALERLERAGFLMSRWEDPVVAEAERRPRRRLYRVTEAGVAALARHRVEQPARVGRLESEPAS